MAAPGAVRCPLPHLLGMPLVMVPLGEDLRLPNKGPYQAASQCHICPVCCCDCAPPSAQTSAVRAHGGVLLAATLDVRWRRQRLYATLLQLPCLLRSGDVPAGSPGDGHAAAQRGRQCAGAARGRARLPAARVPALVGVPVRHAAAAVCRAHGAPEQLHHETLMLISLLRCPVSVHHCYAVQFLCMTCLLLQLLPPSLLA